jgi:hypothetical protein
MEYSPVDCTVCSLPAKDRPFGGGQDLAYQASIPRSQESNLQVEDILVMEARWKRKAVISIAHRTVADAFCWLAAKLPGSQGGSRMGGLAPKLAGILSPTNGPGCRHLAHRRSPSKPSNRKASSLAPPWVGLVLDAGSRGGGQRSRLQGGG